MKPFTFIEPEDVETQVFDWGRLSWLSEPRTTGTERFSAGLVVLEPGKGHVRHNHPGVEEILYIIEGVGIQMVEIEGRPVDKELTEGMLVHIPPDGFRPTVNDGRVRCACSPCMRRRARRAIAADGRCDDRTPGANAVTVRDRGAIRGATPRRGPCWRRAWRGRCRR